MNMKTTHRAVRPYEAPEAEEIRVDMERGFLFNSITGSRYELKAADDLEDIETDAGNAIWN